MSQPGGAHRPEYYKGRLDVAVDEYRRLVPYLTVHTAHVLVEKEELEKRDEEIQQLKSEIEGLSGLKSIVMDMAKELRELKKGTALWEKAEKMGFMGLKSEREDR